MSKTLAGVPEGRSIADIATIARELFSGVEGAIRHKQQLRPYICPFHILVDHVPAGASILDVGCGAGLFILLLARMGRISSGLGFDADGPAIAAANAVAAGLPNAAALRFEHRTAHAQWPEGTFDVVSIIDVLHHVPPDKQANVIATAASRVAPGGILLYKDMARRPLWRAWANRLHDLLSVREWIHYAPIEDVERWARAAGLGLEARGALDMLWYRHEWRVFRRAAVGKM